MAWNRVFYRLAAQCLSIDRPAMDTPAPCRPKHAIDRIGHAMARDWHK